MDNKQQTPLEWFIEQLEEKGDLRETPSIRNVQLNIDTSDYMELKIKAKEMEKERMVDFANNCVKQIEVSDTCELLMVESPKDLYQQTYGGGEQ
jgi:hypothetical protein